MRAIVMPPIVMPANGSAVAPPDDGLPRVSGMPRLPDWIAGGGGILVYPVKPGADSG
jgi:hypothetical protein